MSDEWAFHDVDEDKLSFWTLQWMDSDDHVLVIWPSFKETGLYCYSFGWAYCDNQYYEFEYQGCRPTLEIAKEACAAWGKANFPEDVS